jgi:hypothetical protein
MSNRIRHPILIIINTQGKHGNPSARLVLILATRILLPLFPLALLFLHRSEPQLFHFHVEESLRVELSDRIPIVDERLLREQIGQG